MPARFTLPAAVPGDRPPSVPRRSARSCAAVPHRCLSRAKTALSRSRIFVAVVYRCLSRAEAAVSRSGIFVAVVYRCLSRAEAAVSHSGIFVAVPHRCLSRAETALSHSRIFVAVPHRCLSRAETAVSHSGIFVAVVYRCLSRAETALSHSRVPAAVVYRCLSCVEAAVRHNWWAGLGWALRRVCGFLERFRAGSDCEPYLGGVIEGFKGAPDTAGRASAARWAVGRAAGGGVVWIEGDGTETDQRYQCSQGERVKICSGAAEQPE
jgi:hypothetical protein